MREGKAGGCREGWKRRARPPSGPERKEHMRILGIGVDLVEVDRIERAAARHEGFVPRLFSPREKARCMDCSRPALRYAACFAAKEAAAKALGTGIRGFSWNEIELLAEEGGRPRLVLSGRARELATSLGVSELQVSISHTRGMVVAVAQALEEGP